MIETEQFSKGWTNAALHSQFCEAVKAGDCFAIATAVNAQGADRRPVDCYVQTMSIDGMSVKPYQSNEGDEQRRIDNMPELYELAGLRDEQMSNVPVHFPVGLRELSMFLEQQPVRRYESGVDYLTETDEFMRVHAGGSVQSIDWDEYKTIETLRDLCSYVHSDDPYELWTGVARWLLRNGVAQRLQDSINDHDGTGQDRFTVFGVPFMSGLIGMAGLYAGEVSFKGKWRNLVRRPEQLAAQQFQLLPQAFPEGSPMHPSMAAMHSMMAIVFKHILLGLFDNYHLLPSGRTVQNELNLLADNVGYGRCAAGVHYYTDHTEIEVVAEKIAKQILRKVL